MQAVVNVDTKKEARIMTLSHMLVTIDVVFLCASASGQTCIDGYNKPPGYVTDGLPVAWPKTVSVAQTYVGHVEYQIFTGLVYKNGNYYMSAPNDPI